MNGLINVAVIRYLLFFLYSGLFVSLGFAQETNNSIADSVTYIQFNTLPEGSYVDSVFVDFSGVWTWGWEYNEFTPCGSWVPDSLGGAA